MSAASARAMVLALLDAREPSATVCPSEVARRLAAETIPPAADEWRGAMPAVHEAVDGLVSDGLIRLRWKGESLDRRAGPYRIGRAEDIAASE